MTNVERMDFVIWASPKYPRFTTDYRTAVQARWDYRKHLRSQK